MRTEKEIAKRLSQAANHHDYLRTRESNPSLERHLKLIEVEIEALTWVLESTKSNETGE